MSYLKPTPLIAMLMFAPIVTLATAPSAPDKVAFHFKIVLVDASTHKSSQVGTADYVSSSTPTERFTSFTVDAKDGEDPVIFTLSKTLDLHGLPHTMKYEGNNRGTKFSVTAKYVASAVEVSSDPSKPPQSIPIPRNAVLEDPSEEWFKSVVPKMGDQVSSTVFNIQHTQWMQVTTKYVKDESLQVGSKTYSTHKLHIVSSLGTEDSYVDDHGDPVLINQDNQRVERDD